MFQFEQACTLLELELGLFNKYTDWAKDFMISVQILAGLKLTFISALGPTVNVCSAYGGRPTLEVKWT